MRGCTSGVPALLSGGALLSWSDEIVGALLIHVSWDHNDIARHIDRHGGQSAEERRQQESKRRQEEALG